MPSLFPEELDSNVSLYLVHDALRVKLLEDYLPGDESITVENNEVFSKFPDTGIITLTDQCSDIEERAISFSYTGKGDGTFEGLTLLDGFPDVSKSKNITNVTQNVMAQHHNQIKDAIIAVQNFIGIKDEVASRGLAGTMTARTNFLSRLALTPRGWFTASRRLGITPLCVEFKDFSVRDPDLWIWDFGDGSMSIISTGTSGTVSKCYYTPGIYSVKLTVSNAFGSNEVTIPSYINVRVEAPDEATISFETLSSQVYSNGVLRTKINELITIMVNSTGEQALDEITGWVWELNDDLIHDNTDIAVASYGVGGIYDVKLRAETELGAYRTTVFEEIIDVIEDFNIWHMIFDPTSLPGATTKNLFVYEFGMLSETYKAAHVSSTTSVTRDAGFLSGVPNYDRQYVEFRRNNGFSPKSLTASGSSGESVVFWSEGAPNSASSHNIRFRQFNGFSNTWFTPSPATITRQWNWLAMNSDSEIYILFGAPGPGAFAASPTNQTFKKVALSNYAATDVTFTLSNYLNGADELMQNVGGQSEGNFSVYRGVWKDNNGYFIRNDGVGNYFRLKSFYKTGGTLSNLLQSITKLTDVPGATKFEGQMVYMSGGVYLFNNTGEVLQYDPDTNVWSVGGLGVAAPAFVSLQDRTVSNHADPDHRLLAVSDQSTKTYLFFDYSVKAQMKFNETDLTFSSLPVRPSGEQFVAGAY